MLETTQEHGDGPGVPVMSDFLAVRVLPDGRALAVVPLTFGRARLCLGPGDLYTYDKGW